MSILSERRWTAVLGVLAAVAAGVLVSLAAVMFPA
jgi:hypothetical protein